MKGFKGKHTHHHEKRQTPRAKIPFYRVNAEVQVDATKEVAECRVFLNDISPTGVGLFTNIPLDKGALVSIVVEQPKNLFVKGEVMWCSPYTLDTKIISEQNFPYRVGIKFSFENDQEKDTMRKYCEEIYATQK